ncbi:MAG: YbjQ family protein [Gammaproteobacteria bacterium]
MSEIDLIFFVGLLLLGYVFGQLFEKNHYRSIRKRESELSNIPAIASKKLPESFLPCETKLVAGNVVISVDFFKKFIAGLRNIVGGRVTSYENLIDRARREALLRMKEEAKKIHANYVFNVKMETSSISKGKSESIGSVEVLAYGTAVIQKEQTTSP